MTRQSKMVLRYLRTVDTATLEDIYINTDLSYYCNWAKHTGNITSRLVKRGLITRVKKGVFTIENNEALPTETLTIFQ